MVDVFEETRRHADLTEFCQLKPFSEDKVGTIKV